MLHSMGSTFNIAKKMVFIANIEESVDKRVIKGGTSWMEGLVHLRQIVRNLTRYQSLAIKGERSSPYQLGQDRQVKGGAGTQRAKIHTKDAGWGSGSIV